MSDQLDRLFDRIDELTKDAPETEMPDSGVRAVPTAGWIRDENSNVDLTLDPSNSYRREQFPLRHQQVSRTRRGNLVIDLDNIDFDLVRSVCCTTDTSLTIADAARTLGVSVQELSKIRQKDGYIDSVRRRLESYDPQILWENSRVWVTPADKVYANYFRCTIKAVRQILNDINPDILR